MAKPMLVTLPFVLLLLDYWPLQRLESKKSPQEIRAEASKQGAGNPASAGVTSSRRRSGGERKPLSATKKKGESGKMRTGQGIAQSSVLVTPEVLNPGPQSSALRPLLREKIPLFALAALSCIVTYVAQEKGGSVLSFERIGPDLRIANIFVSYIIYIAKSIWPINLAVYYPHRGSWPLWQVLGAVLLLIAVTISVIRTAKRFPYLTMGWLWFTGTLVPVIGIVQVGTQAMADRYTYIPLIGLFVMAAWGIPELLKKWQPTRFPTPRKKALFGSSAILLLSFSIVTWIQVGYWRNDIALYDHSLKVAGPSDVIYRNRGFAYGKLGNKRQAISDFDRAIEINRKYLDAYNNRGIAYSELGNYRQAISDYDRAIEINPEYARPYINRGAAYSELGNQRQAISDFDRAIEINPESAEAYINRGATYGKLGDQRQAISDYDRAIEINPGYAEAYNNRGVTYGELGNLRQAISDYDRAIEINPKYAVAYYNRGVTYGELDNLRQAISDYDRAIEINPKYAVAYYNRGFAHAKLGNRSKAMEDMKTAARFDIENAKNFLKSQGMNW
jgi:tetratricopeptide (TPR) repeat protein